MMPFVEGLPLHERKHGNNGQSAVCRPKKACPSLAAAFIPADSVNASNLIPKTPSLEDS